MIFWFLVGREDGGKTEVWSDLTKTIRVRAGAKTDEIRAAFEVAA